MRALVHTHTHTHTHTLVAVGEGHGCEKTFKLEIVNVCEQMSLEGEFERARSIRVAECLKRTVPNRWVSVGMRIVIVFLKCRVEGNRTGTVGMFQR